MHYYNLWFKLYSYNNGIYFFSFNIARWRSSCDMVPMLYTLHVVIKFCIDIVNM